LQPENALGGPRTTESSTNAALAHAINRRSCLRAPIKERGRSIIVVIGDDQFALVPVGNFLTAKRI